MRYAIITFVPLTHADAIRQALAETHAGKLGNYDSCSFSSKGIGRFRPLKGANPTIGKIGKIEAVEEERIEVMVEVTSEKDLRKIVTALRAAHPYEEPAIHVSPLFDL